MLFLVQLLVEYVRADWELIFHFSFHFFFQYHFHYFHTKTIKREREGKKLRPPTGHNFGHPLDSCRKQTFKGGLNTNTYVHIYYTHMSCIF